MSNFSVHEGMWMDFYHASLDSFRNSPNSQWKVAMCILNIVAIFTINAKLLYIYCTMLSFKIHFTYVRFSQATLEIMESCFVIPIMFSLNFEVLSALQPMDMQCLSSIQVFVYFIPTAVLQVLNAYVIVYWKYIFCSEWKKIDLMFFFLGCSFTVYSFCITVWGFSLACIYRSSKPMIYYLMFYSSQNPGYLTLFLAMVHSYWEAVKMPKYYFSESTWKIWRKMDRMIRFQLYYDGVLYLYWVFQNINSIVKKVTGTTDIAGAFFQSTSHYYLVIGPVIRCGFALWYARINDRGRQEGGTAPVSTPGNTGSSQPGANSNRLNATSREQP